MDIRSRSPVRISFAGGGTDVSPYCEEHGGCVVSATLNKYAWGSMSLRKDSKILMDDIRFGSLELDSIGDIKYDGKLDLLKAVLKHFKPDSGVNLFLRNDVQPKSGLGSSASAFLAVIGLFNHMKKEKKMTDYDLAELAYDLERIELQNKGGRQDQYASVFGGLNYIEFKGNDFVRVNPIHIKEDHILELEKNLILVYAMDRSKSGDVLEDQTRSYVKNKKDVVEALHQTKAIALEVNYALRKGDLNRFGELLDEGWNLKKKFSPLITNPYLDNLYKIAKENGALGGKITGAGGGGHMLFYCEPNKEDHVAQKLSQAGAKVVDFTFDFKGLQTWEI
ncbi:MAG: GHMP kinase [Candidatus Altiarchaeota archaeon]|nr:GHMP kinase [Candidatus Altiarchaeota archaeon]